MAISLLTDIVTPTYVLVILIDINGKYTVVWTCKGDRESKTFLDFHPCKAKVENSSYCYSFTQIKTKMCILFSLYI